MADLQSSDEAERLFLALAEELKLPLQQIARQAELGQLIDGNSQALGTIQSSADGALRLLDSYMLSAELLRLPGETFAVEPVSVAAVLHETKSQLHDLARRYNVTLDLEVAGKYAPVLAHERALRSALVSLGYTLIEALPAHGIKNCTMRLSAHRGKGGLIAGLYCNNIDFITPEMFRRSKLLFGRARQPMVGASPNSAAGIFVADTILKAMSSNLRVSKYQKQAGFAVTLPFSAQLQLV